MASHPLRIDAHQHFWRFDPVEYDWIGSSQAVLRRDFLPEDLAPLLHTLRIDGSIAVQARQTVKETRWLLQLARENDFIRGVVGWVPLTQPPHLLDVILESLTSDSKLRGIRHVVQGEPDGFLARDDFNRGVALLRDFGLTYDLLIHEHQLEQAIAFVDRHPQQIFVLDHLAKPRIRDGALEPWKTRIQEMSRRPHVVCKVSGLVTEADHERWQAADLQPYWDTILECFGPERLLFGSDWPVCLLGAAYTRWQEIVEAWCVVLSEPEQVCLWGDTACQTYRLIR